MAGNYIYPYSHSTIYQAVHKDVQTAMLLLSPIIFPLPLTLCIRITFPWLLVFVRDMITPGLGCTSNPKPRPPSPKLGSGRLAIMSMGPTGAGATPSMESWAFRVRTETTWPRTNYRLIIELCLPNSSPAGPRWPGLVLGQVGWYACTLFVQSGQARWPWRGIEALGLGFK